MLIRQKAGWRLHHQAYLWPKRYKSSPASSLTLGLSTQPPGSPLSLNTISSPLSRSTASKRKRTAAKRASMSVSNTRQQREREAAKRRHIRASKTLPGGISSRRISSPGSDGVPSPTSPSSSSSSSSSSVSSSSTSPSPRKLSRGHLELPWFLGSGPCMLKPWEEPFLDSSDKEDQEETIAVRLRRHTRKRRSSGQDHDVNNMAAMTSSTVTSQKPTAATVTVENDVRTGDPHGVIAGGCRDVDMRSSRTISPDLESDPQESHSRRSQENSLSVRTRSQEFRSGTPTSPVTCNQFHIINASSPRSDRHSNLRGSKNITNNVVIIINNNNGSSSSNAQLNSDRNHIPASNCGNPKTPECSRENGISRARRTMGVLYTDKHPGGTGEGCEGTHVSSPRPASLPSLPPSPESSSIDDTSPSATTSSSFSTTKSSGINLSRQQESTTGSRKRPLSTAFPEAAKEQEHITPSRRIRTQQRLPTTGTLKEQMFGADQKDSIDSNIKNESSEDCYLTLALSPEETGNFLVHPSVTVTVFSGVSRPSNGLTQLQHLKELACKDCPYCRDRLSDWTGVEGRQSNIRSEGEGSPTSFLNVAQPPKEAEQCGCGQERLPPCCLDNKPVTNECCHCELYSLRHHCQNEHFTKHSPLQCSSPTSALSPSDCVLSTSQPLSEPPITSGQNLPCQSDSLPHKENRLTHNRPGTGATLDPVDTAHRPGDENYTFPKPAAKHNSEPQPYRLESNSSAITDNRQQSQAQEYTPSSKGSTIPPSGTNLPSNGTLSQSQPTISTPFSLTTSEAAVAADEDTKEGKDVKLRQRLPPNTHRPALSRSSSTDAVSSSVGSSANLRQGSTSVSSPASPVADNSHSGVLPPPPPPSSSSPSQCRSSSFPRPEQRQHNKLGKGLSSRPSTPSPALSSVPATSTVECKWRGCKRSHDLDPSDLLEHIRQHAEEQIANKAYACLWSDCKVFNKPSWSGSWLERHIVTHSGHRPFKCILDNCGQRFHSQAALERHVNSHFGAGAGGSTGCASAGVNGVGHSVGHAGKSGARSKEDMGQPRMTLKRKRQLKRRCTQTVRKNDFFDEQSMAVIRQDLLSLTARSGLDVVPGARPLGVTFHRQVVGRRTDKSGEEQLLVEHSPSNILEDAWLSNEEPQTDGPETSEGNNAHLKGKSVSSNSCVAEELCGPVTLPLYALPSCSVTNLHPSVYRKHRFRKHRRK